MSEEMGNKADVAVSLEDLFLSREFGQVSGATPSTPRLSPFGPGHATTTHGRRVRSRTYGVMSAAAAVALVVAVGLSGARLTPSRPSGITSALGAPASNGHLNRGGATGGVPAATGGGTTTAPPAGSLGAGAGPVGGTATQVAALTGRGGSTSGSNGGTGTGTPPAAKPAPTPPAQNPVTPVVDLIDTAVSTVTSTVTGVSTVTASPSTPTASTPPTNSGPPALPAHPVPPVHHAPPVHPVTPANAHSPVHLVAIGAGHPQQLPAPPGKPVGAPPHGGPSAHEGSHELHQFGNVGPASVQNLSGHDGVRE